MLKPDQIDALAEFVAFFASTDKQPDGKDSQEEWQFDGFLIGKLDAHLVGSLKDYRGYAEVARLAEERLVVAGFKGSETLALLKIAQIRGERLQPMTPFREAALLEMFEQTEAVIKALPDGAKKRRLLSLLYYNAGVFYDALGNFDEAAKNQAKSAELCKLLGDLPGEAVARFTEMVYRLKAALCQPSTDEARAVFAIMAERYHQLVDATRGSNLETLWGKWNGPVHMILALIWLNIQDHPIWGELVATASDAAKVLGKGDHPLAHLVIALDLHKRDHKDAVVALAAVVTETSNTEDPKLREIYATALMVMARRFLAKGKQQEAVDLIAQIPEKATLHVHTIMARETGLFKKP